MNLKKIASTVAGIAPTLAAGLGAPGLAVTALAAVSRAVLGHAGGTVEQVEEALGNLTPEASANLYQANLDFRQEMGRQGIRLVEIEHANTADARAMQRAALVSDDSMAKRFVYLFAAGWSAFAMAYLVGITFFDVPKESLRFADTAQGFILGTIVAQILNFFFGSSHSSRAKDDTIQALGSKQER